MKPSRSFLPGISHPVRSVFFMAGAVGVYCLWLWLLTALEIMTKETPGRVATALFLAPFVPIGVFDLWLRLSWRQETPTLYPPPPGLRRRLLEREYGLYWFPVLICVPLWLWCGGLIGWSLYIWIQP